MPEGGGENLPRVISRINDPIKKQELQQRTAALIGKPTSVSNEPFPKKDGTLTTRGVAETFALRDMGKIAHARRQRLKRKEAEKKSLHDSLTNLRNRRWLLGGENGDGEAVGQGELEGILDRAKRDGKQVSVLFVDVDDFKPHNNTTKGDAGGDQDLIAVARILTNSTRSSDVAVRLGGDEFVVVCEGAAGEDATGIAELIVENVEEESTKPTGSEFNMPTTVSIGYVTYPNREGLSSPKELVGAANAAQKLAKERGKSRVAPWFRGINSPK